MKKAFTLIELISVIIILSIIALISVPITTNIINSSRNKAYEETINNIIEISKNYSVYNNLGYNTLYKELTFDELENKGYIESSDIINPKTNQKLAGCVIYRWVIGSNQYEFKYDETCNGKASYPEIVINVTPDSESWITEKPTFDIEGEYESFKYCIEESECNPNIDYNNRVTVEKESKNLIICATGYNNKEVGKTTCTKGYKVDRTNPTLTYNITTSTNKIIVNASCTDDISGISKKEYSINDKEYQDNNTFSNLSKGTYKISVKCTDNAGLTTVKSSNVALENIKNPVIAQLSQIPTNTSYAQQRIIKINYSSEGIENPEYYFKSSVAASVASGVVVQSCGTGNTPSTCTTSSVTSLVANTWYRTNNSSINVTYTSNGTLYAVTKDNTNVSGTSTYSIANIDTTPPPKPSITLDKNYDSGVSNTDNITNIYKNVRFTGNAEANSTIDIRLISNNWDIIKQVTTGSNGAYEFNIDLEQNKTNRVYICSVDAAGNYTCNSLDILVDTTPPSISFRVKSGACVGVNAHKISCFSDAEIEIIVSDNNSASTLYWGICNMSSGCSTHYAYDLIVNNGSNDMDSSQSIIKTGSISVPLGSQVKIFSIGYDSANNSTLPDTEYFEYAGNKYNYINIES